MKSESPKGGDFKLDSMILTQSIKRKNTQMVNQNLVLDKTRSTVLASFFPAIKLFRILSRINLKLSFTMKSITFLRMERLMKKQTDGQKKIIE